MNDNCDTNYNDNDHYHNITQQKQNYYYYYYYYVVQSCTLTQSWVISQLL